MKHRLTALLISIVMVVSSWPAAAFADTAEPARGVEKAVSYAQYAVVYEDGEMVFQASDAPIDGKTIKSVYSLDYTGSVPWRGESGFVTRVTFADPVAPSKTANWFASFEKLEAIDGLEKLDTSNVTNMAGMFNGCGSLFTLDVSGFETGNVTNMASMFSGCFCLSTLAVSGFDTRNVTSMASMFSGCYGLSALDVSGFDTANVTNMLQLFYGCMGLSTLNLSNFDTTNVTSMSRMFCDCNSLTVLDLSSFSTGNVTDMTAMFDGCANMTALNISGFNTGNVTDMSAMFRFCASLRSLDVSGFDTSDVTNMSGMFSDCAFLTVLDLSSFDTSNVTDMGEMFNCCSLLKTIYASDAFVTDGVNCDMMFGSCTSLVGGNGTTYDGSPTDGEYARIDKEGVPGFFTPAHVHDLYAVEATVPTPAQAGNSAYWVCSGCGKYFSDAAGENEITENSWILVCEPTITVTAEAGRNVITWDVIDGATKYTIYRRANESGSWDSWASLTTQTATSYIDSAVIADAIYEYRAKACGNGDWSGYSNRVKVTALASSPSEEYARYAVVYEDGEMVFQKESESVDERIVKTVYSLDYIGYSIPWHTESDFVTKVIFADPVAPSSTARWFSEFNKLQSIEGLEKLDTSNVINMSYMFIGCNSLTTIDVSGFDTSNVTDMHGMFQRCNSLSVLDVSGFITDNVEDMAFMFSSCESLTMLDVSGFDTSHVTEIYAMFSGCSSLRALDVSGFDTKNATDMMHMFFACSSLTTLDVSGFDTSNVTSMMQMFFYCTSLRTLDVSEFNTANVTDTTGMFEDCRSLTALDVSSFDTSNVTNMLRMFYDCNSLKTIYASDSFTTDASDSSGNSFNIFYGCENLVGGNGTVFNSTHIDGEYARIDTAASPGYFTYRHTHNLCVVEAVEPTATQIGNSAYWYCSGCGKYFNDAEGKHEIAKDSWILVCEPTIAVSAQAGKNVVSWETIAGAVNYALYRRSNEIGSWSTWTVVSTQTGTEYVDKGVITGYNYEYRAKTGGKGGWSGYSNRVTVTALAPLPPAAPEITVTATAEKVTVRWDAVPDAVKYQVFRREKSDGKWSAWTLVSSAKALLFNDKNVTGGVVYQYRAKSVRTLNDGSSLKSSYSNREMVGLAKPDAPVIKVKATAGKNTVSWAAVTGAKYYVVYWRVNNNDDWSAWTMSDPVTGTSYAHTSLTSGLEYQYRVRAGNGVWSEYSNRVSVTAK